MVGRVINFDSDEHRSVFSLLPWWVNGTLGDEELAAVERHVRDCPKCRREAEFLREVQSVCSDDDVAAGASRIDLSPPHGLDAGTSDPAGVTARPGVTGFAHAWMPWAFAIQFVVILGLGLWLVHERSPAAVYRTLGEATVELLPADNVVVRFAPQTPESVLRRILQQAGAQIVAGPSQEGAYVLRFDGDGRRDAALRALRGEPAVLIAESLGPE